VEGGGGLLSGVSTVIIDGQNFTTDSSKVIVFFDALRATVVSTSLTQIKVKAPVVVKDSIKIRVTILGALNFSEVQYVDVKAAVALFGNFTSFEEAYGIACDQSGNLFVSMMSSGIGIGLRKYTEAGDTSKYASSSSQVIFVSGIKMGPNGLLYGCNGNRVIYTVAQNATPVPWAIQPQRAVGTKYPVQFRDLDFDKHGNIWTGGNDTAIYRILPNKTITQYVFEANIRSIRVFQDYLYLGGKVDSVSGVWRAPIDDSGNLGAITKYFDLSSQPGYAYNGAGVTAITFNSEGEMYVGTNGNDGILLVRPSDSSIGTPLYPGLFTANAENYSFAWGSGSTLYVTRRNNGISTISQTLIKINTQKQSAPYYGRGDI
jgi:hypothetical protein